MIVKKIPHLIRYFFFLGVITFVGYIKDFQQDIFLALSAPCIYVAHSLYTLITTKVISLPNTQSVKYFGFLMPVCLIYFCFIGFQLKQLWNERGIIRWIILIVFVGFLLYVHFIAYQKLSEYMVPSF